MISRRGAFAASVFLCATLACTSTSKRGSRDAGGADDVSGGTSLGDAPGGPSDGVVADDTTVAREDSFVGQFGCLISASGPGLPEGLSPVQLIVTSTDLGGGQVRWDSTHERGQAASIFEVCPAVFEVDGSVATLVPNETCVMSFTSGTASLTADGRIEANLVSTYPDRTMSYSLDCARAIPTTPPEPVDDFEGPWTCTGSVAGGSGATSLTFEAELTRPTEDTVKVNSREGIAGAIGFCGPVYVLTDETHGVLAADATCGIGALGKPTGGTLTLESEGKLSGTLAVDGKTFGTTTFACER